VVPQSLLLREREKTNHRGAERTGLFSDSVRMGLSEANSRTLAAGKTAPSTNEQKAETFVSAFLF